MNKVELEKVLRNASAKIETDNMVDKGNRPVRFWLLHALEHGIEDAILEWADDL